MATNQFRYNAAILRSTSSITSVITVALSNTLNPIGLIKSFTMQDIGCFCRDSIREEEISL